MAKILTKRVRASVAAAILGLIGITSAGSPSPAFGRSSSTYADSPSDVLARNLRILATNSRNFKALVGAGRAALDLGDAQAAAGFFGRAEEVNSNSPLVHAGIGAALNAAGDPRSALSYFARAQLLGATPASLGCERGLAYDLLGYHSTAQNNYLAASFGPDRDEARRRLALSLAMSGDKSSALEMLEPLLAHSDSAARRISVLVLALSGDMAEAKTALSSSSPAAWHRLEPFLQRLPALTSKEKAAAVHLGIFPGGELSTAPASTGGDSLTSSDQMLLLGELQPPAGRPVPGAMRYGAARLTHVEPQPQTRGLVPGPMQYGAARAPEPLSRTPKPAEQR